MSIRNVFCESTKKISHWTDETKNHASYVE